MRLDYYYYLIRLVEVGSLSKAAATLYVSPQGLSKAIQQMNDELNTTIFYRDKHGLHLTSAGETVYEAAKKIVAIQDTLKKRLTSYANAPEDSEMVIYASPHINIAFLHRCINKYFRKNSKAKFKLVEMPPLDICKVRSITGNKLCMFSLLETELDPFLSTLEDGYSFREIARSRVLLRVANTSPLAIRKAVSFEDLNNYDLALYSEEKTAVKALFGNDSVTKIGVLVSDYARLCEMIAKDNTLVGLTDTLIEQNLKFPSVKAVPLKNNVDTIYGYLVKDDTPFTPEAEGLLAVIFEELQIDPHMPRD